MSDDPLDPNAYTHICPACRAPTVMLVWGWEWKCFACDTSGVFNGQDDPETIPPNFEDEAR